MQGHATLSTARLSQDRLCCCIRIGMQSVSRADDAHVQVLDFALGGEVVDDEDAQVTKQASAFVLLSFPFYIGTKLPLQDSHSSRAHCCCHHF